MEFMPSCTGSTKQQQKQTNELCTLKKKLIAFVTSQA